VKRRYLRQLWRYGAAIGAARADLLALRDRPVEGELSWLLVAAWDRIPFWRERMRRVGLIRADLARGAPALAALPPLTRAEVQARFHDLRDPAPDGDDYVGTTSGSTGEPARYVADGFGFLWFWAFVPFALALAGRARPPLRPLGNGVHLLCALSHSPEYGSLVPLLRWTRFRKWNVRAPGFADAIARAAPAVCTGDPDSLAALLGTRARPRLLLSSAFAMPVALRERLERETRAAVLEYYSAAETGPIGVACPLGRGFHVLTPAALVEDAPVPGAQDGARELLVTNLRNRRFPLIRYALGDLGRVEPDDGCPCGLRAPRVVALSGRTAALFARADGGRFDPAGVNPVLARIPGLLEARLEERGPGAYRLLYRAGAPLGEEALEAIRARLAFLRGGAASLEVVRAGAPLRAPGEKPRPFVALAAPGALV
jgi:phenylacetate-CoA ligase